MDSSEYVIVDARGGQIGFLSCGRCGATIMLSQTRDNGALHDQWHAETSEREPNA